MKMFRMRLIIFNGKKFSTSVKPVIVKNQAFERDSFSNVTPHILSFLDKNLYKKKAHPISFIKERIVNFINNRFKTRRGNAVFSVYDDLSPIVSIQQNFDSLLIPPDHPSRSKNDCYYFNQNWMLRAHMTAHQSELIKSGLNNFLMVGDVYRKDTVDHTHYPVFHQLDGVRLFTPEELFVESDDGMVKLEIKENGERTKEKQAVYTLEASKMVEADLKVSLEDLAKEMFGNEVPFRWVEVFFPFTHPSWELEIMLNDKWTEILGCGVIEYSILENAGCSNRIGWAFGAGLERLAMHYYSIPDIRVFWSTDSGFLHQFEGKSCNDKITFKQWSLYPPCAFDISFWVKESFEPKDFYELVWQLFSDEVEQINEIDVYKCPKTGRESRTYRITYRSMKTTLTKKYVNQMHKILEGRVTKMFNVELR